MQDMVIQRIPFIIKAIGYSSVSDTNISLIKAKNVFY